MVDILQTGISGLRASQRGLATTSHNTSNVNTDGYSRQRTEQDTSIPQYHSRGATGTGTQVQTIQRLSEGHRVEALRNNHAEFERLDKLEEMTGRIDDLVADGDAGLSPAMRQFFDAVEEVANDPEDTVAKQQLLNQGQALSDRFKTLDNRLLTLQEDVNKRVRTEVDEINGLAHSIAELNDEIRQRWGDPRRPPNDLLDQRDEHIRELAEHVNVRVTEQDDGALNVGIGNGQALVTGHQANPLEITRNAFDPERPELAVRQGDHRVQMTNALRGGSLGGMLEFREGVLDETRQEIGRVATSLAGAMNEQHRRGIQFDSGQPEAGGDFFRYAQEVPVLSSEDNTGEGRPRVVVDEQRIGELTGDSYQLSFDGEQWRVASRESGQVRTLGTGEGADLQPGEDGGYRIDGLVLYPPDAEEAGVEAGDRFLVEPTREAAGRLETNLSRPQQVAAAAPAVTGEVTGPDGQTNNTGRARISAPDVGDAEGVMAALGTGGALGDGVEMAFDADSRTFEVRSGGEALGRFEYDPEDPERGQMVNLARDVEPAGEEAAATLEGLDLSVRIAGEPDDGDQFGIYANEEGVGDNTNALRMAELMEEPVMDNGNSTFQETYSAMVGDLGGFSQRVQTNRDAQETLLNQAQEQWEELSGVNLDEEAANMMEYQQAYQAAAQIITTANEVFQEMLGAVRR
ncbi:MAG: flagellar hook-associated protein FlgK [Halorhodospira sp.]